MPSLIPGFEYDVFISYRHKDNKYDGWVSDFVSNLKRELEATFKEEVSVYFDENADDGLLETHSVNKSLEGKLKSLIFIPIISQTYCDPKSYAWQHEFCVFNRLANDDAIGRDIKLSYGNVASRVLSVRIHSLDYADRKLLETELGESLRSIDFIFKSAGVNRPLRANEDNPQHNVNRTYYRDQVNKVANAIKEIIQGVKGEGIVEKEVTPVRRIEPVKTQNKHKGKLITAGIISLLVFAAAHFLYTYQYEDRQVVAEATMKPLDKSIAVLPFANMSSDPEQEYFSSGLTEDIITQLAKIKSFKVISRSSVLKYKDSPKSSKEIGREMGVAVILEGSVQRSGDQVRINANLINAATDEHLWAESYDRPVKDIFAIQREVASAIASVLQTTLSPGETDELNKLKTQNLQAYDVYLHGKYAMELPRTKSDMYKAKSFFEQAVALDPDFALAYSGLADVHLLLCNRGYLDPAAGLADAKQYIDKALELDPNSAQIQASSGYWYNQSFNFKEAETRFVKSITMNPNQDNVYNWLAQLLEQTGRPEEALAIYKKGIAVNPSFRVLNANMLNLLFTLEPDEAIRLTKIQIDSSFNEPQQRIFYLIALSKYYWLSGFKEEAITTAEQTGISGFVKFYRDGSSNELVSMLNDNYQESVSMGEHKSSFYRGMDYALIGARDLAISNFDKALKAKEPALPALLLRGFHAISLLPKNDPKLMAMKKKIKTMIEYDWPSE